MRKIALFFKARWVIQNEFVYFALKGTDILCKGTAGLTLQTCRENVFLEMTQYWFPFP